MICLTGDVHHSSLKTVDLKFCQGSEIDAALTMAKIAKSHGVKLTLFFTGKCVAEAPGLVRQIAKMSNVELGGHNYWAFKPKKLFNAYARLTKRNNGPGFFQAYEIKRTIKALESVSFESVRSWRNHAYRNDRNTRWLLVKNYVRYLSDVLSADSGQPIWNGDIIDVPINTLPDHDFVYHGERQPGKIDESPLMESVFNTGAISKEDWLKQIKKQVSEIDNQKGVAVILAHPACMECMDDFATFQSLCRFIKKKQTIKMKEIVVTG